MNKRKINIGGKDYELFLNRRSIIWLEKQGFSAEKLDVQPLTMYSLLFECAFIAKYPNEDVSALMDKYEEEGGDLNEVVQFLIEEYTAFMTALADTESKKKKMEII